MKQTSFTLRKRIPFIAGLLLCSVSLAGCGYGTKSDIQELQTCIDQLTQSNYQLEKRVAALESQASPAATPLPSVIVTTTPQPGSTPRVYSMTADEICSSLLKAGMPIVSFTRYTKGNDPNGLLGTNGGYTSRADFKDKNTPDVQGIIEVYASAHDATVRLNALEFARAQSNGVIPDEMAFCYDNVLLRLPEGFTEEQGVQYEDALRKVLGLIG